MKGQVFVAVAGNIGSGKTTLTERLAESLSLTALYEDTADNPYLADFYADMSRWAMALQLRFLGVRAARTRDLLEQGASLVQDRTCYEDAEIFAPNLRARGALDGRDWETYQLLAAPLLKDLPAPDLLVYVRRTPRHCSRQIDSRGRRYERSIPEDYLIELGDRYDEWFAAYERGPKLLVEADNKDFLDERDLRPLLAQIIGALPQLPLPL